MGGNGNDTIDVEKLSQLPQEVKDEILLYIGSFDLAIRLQRYCVAGKLYNVFKEIPENVIMKIIKCISSKTKNDLMLSAAIKGYYTVIKTLISDPQVDDDTFNISLSRACEYGQEDIAFLLLQDRRIDPSAKNNEAIRMASSKGHDKIVDLLLVYPRVNPSDDSNKAITSASGNGHFKVVKLLLTDPRVDPSVSNNYPLVLASQNGYFNIVKLLLRDTRVQNRDTERALYLASQNGYLNIVELLLKGSRVGQNVAALNKAIDVAAYYSYRDIVNLLFLQINNINGNGSMIVDGVRVPYSLDKEYFLPPAN